jgi:E3 ubiquitin-protein ligase HUWE1
MMEDPLTREHVAAQNLHGFALTSLESLAESLETVPAGTVVPPPKWVCMLLLAFDVLLQMKPKPAAAPAGTGAALARVGGATAPPQIEAAPTTGTDIEPAGEPQVPAKTPVEQMADRQAGFVTLEDQTRAIGMVVTLVQKWYPLPAAGGWGAEEYKANAEAMSGAQTLLQVASRLTRTHSIALCFQSRGGVEHLLRLPPSCLFPGYESVAAAILRHVLEDGPTLQAAMEAEIRSTMSSSSVVRANGRMSPRALLTSLSSVMARNPATFMVALQAVCVTEEAGGRTMLVLAKTKEPHSREPRDSTHRSADPSTPFADKPKDTAAPRTPAGTEEKKSERVKSGRLRAHPGFSAVVDLLIELVLAFQPQEDETEPQAACAAAEGAGEMEVDFEEVAATGDNATGKQAATTEEEKKKSTKANLVSNDPPPPRPQHSPCCIPIQRPSSASRRALAKELH